MNREFYCVSSLPRSGSTLLCNILAQNPRFHATHTSGCLDVLFGIRNQWHQLIEHKAHPDDASLQRVLKAILMAYYEDVEKPVIIEKSRGWMAYLELLEQILGKQAKILVPIRPLPDILSSMEKLNRETSRVKQPSGEAENYFQFQTQEGRCEYWLRGDNLVGLAYNRVMDAIQRGFKDRLHFIKFNELTTNPKDTLNSIYEFLGEEPYEHNFNHVEQVTTENDELHGYVGLHTIKPKVVAKSSDAVEILGQQLVKKYANLDPF